jgi:hypothetical protein
VVIAGTRVTRARAGAILGLLGLLLMALAVIAPPAQATPKGHAKGWSNHHLTVEDTVTSLAGPYDPHDVGVPSGNGNGDGNASGKPCAGCVGNADGKNPPGQLPGPGEPNVGYECDGNNGVAKGNPAHSLCDPGTTTTTELPTTTTTEAPTTTTTEAPTTTTAEVTTTTEAATTTTAGATVLGEQLTRGDELARTGGFVLSPIFALGLLLAVAGAVMVVGQPQALGRRERRVDE